ncbi:MAG: chemotaxis protein CheV [Desulfovibrio sp.]|nr:chemotaxis protein CheV [Desulfovibrio sp.]
MAKGDITRDEIESELEIIEFFIDEQAEEGREAYRAYYGISVAKVVEIIRMPKVTEMPNTPHPSVVGTFNLRSRVIPLIDLSLWLGKPMVRDANTKVIVTEFNTVINAFMVSGVTRIHRLNWDEVEPPRGYTAAFASHSFTGVVKFRDRIVLLLDMERILMDLNPNLAMRMDRAGGGRPTAAAGHKTLVVDDSEAIRKLIASYLEADGFTVAQDINGRNAWDRIEAVKREAAASGRPISDYLNLVVTDIEMPSMNGYALCSRIKADPALASLPVILFSSIINDRMYEKGREVGADDQVTKPEIETLAERAKKLIEPDRG